MNAAKTPKRKLSQTRLWDMNAEEAERQLREMWQPSLVLGILNRLKHAPGARQRQAQWNRIVRQNLERMRVAHTEGEELAAYDALKYCSDINALPPRWAVDSILKEARDRIAEKKTRTMQQHRIYDLMCLKLVNEERAKGKSLRASWKAAARHFNKETRTIRSACERAEKHKGGYLSQLAASANATTR